MAITPATSGGDDQPDPFRRCSICFATFWTFVFGCGIIVPMFTIGANNTHPASSSNLRNSVGTRTSSTPRQPGLHMSESTNHKEEVVVVVDHPENATETMAALLRRASAKTEGSCDEDATEAQDTLGSLYSNGDQLDVKANATAAAFWFQKAIDNVCNTTTASSCPASARSKYGLGLLYVEGKLRDDGITKAADWIEESAKEGCGIAQHSLGALYFSGEWIPQDYTMAVHWYQQAAAQNISESQDSLGFMYMNGLGGLQQNYTTAAGWFRLAAIAGNDEAQGYLGFLFYNGYGVPQNDALAACLFQLSAQEGYKDSQNYLAEMIQEGRAGSLKRESSGKIIEVETGDCL